jgi:hypothetical protein
MAVDAWINNDLHNVNVFMILACALDAKITGGVEVLETFKQGCQVSQNARVREASDKLKGHLEKLSTSNATLLQVMEEFVTCDCIARARKLGQGLLATDQPQARTRLRTDSDSSYAGETDISSGMTMTTMMLNTCPRVRHSPSA